MGSASTPGVPPNNSRLPTTLFAEADNTTHQDDEDEANMNPIMDEDGVDDRKAANVVAPPEEP